MADDTHKLSITYSSRLIPPPEHMSTLAVFYDEIWLPYPYDLDQDGIQILPVFNRMAEINAESGARGIYKIRLEARNAYRQQRERWYLLFNRDICRILSPSLEANKAKKAISSYMFNENLMEFYENYNHERDIRTGYIYLALHSLYADKPSPELFISNPLDTSTSRLAGFIVNALFQYQVPQLQALNAEQILEVRDYLKDTKEGFTHYIFEMTDDVERRIREHNLSDLEASQKTFERKIQPQYEEFRRKLAAKKTGFWSRVAVAGGKFMQVDATPWSIRFLGAVLEMCGVSLDELSKSEQENFLSNKSQAFNYIAILESEVSRRSP